MLSFNHFSEQRACIFKFKFLRECKLNPPTNHERFHPKCQTITGGCPEWNHHTSFRNRMGSQNSIPFQCYILHTDNHHLAVLACAEVGWILSPRGAGLTSISQNVIPGFYLSNFPSLRQASVLPALHSRQIHLSWFAIGDPGYYSQFMDFMLLLFPFFVEFVFHTSLI